MTTQEAREIFNEAAKAAEQSGDTAARDRIEICREYFTNPEFRQWLHAHTASETVENT